MPAYLLEPSTAPASIPDYSSSIGNITTELNEIDTDTTSIATSLAMMASNSTAIKNSLVAIENSLNSGSTTVVSTLGNIEAVLAEIEKHQKRIRELGETTGYRMKSPYEIFSMVSIYKLLIEEAKILELDPAPGKQTEALNKVLEYMKKINESIPKEF